MSLRRILKTKQGTSRARGFSVLEAMIASMIMLVGVGGLMALFVVAAAKNSGQGDQATRTTEYAQDKMEQLLALQYTDTSSNTVGSSTTPTGGVGLTPGNSPIGQTANYVDYVTAAGVVSGSSAGALYVREWSITVNTTTNIKTITVVVQAQFTADAFQSLAPSTTLVAMKEQY